MESRLSTHSELNLNQIRIRSNGKISKIDMPKYKLERLNKILAKSNLSEMVRRRWITELAGGLCCMCRGGDAIPLTQISYDISDEKQAASLVERYCNSCIKKVYSREPVL